MSSFVFLLLLGFTQAPQQTPAAKALAIAESRASKGSWKSAHDKYWNMRRLHKGTSEAAIADQRLQMGWLGAMQLEHRGPSKNRVDVVITGDAFEVKDLKSLNKLATDVVLAFDRNPTLGEYQSCFNFHLMGVFSREGGVSGLGRERYDNAFGASTWGDKTHVRVDTRRVRTALRQLKVQDGLAVVLVDKPGLLGTGGGGIATVAGRPDKNTVIHEWGHAFAGLADEYSSDVGYTGNPSESANLSTQDDEELVPWAHFLKSKSYRGKIGVHRGGGGRAKGTWKPTVRGCAMVGSGDYCPVCREQIILALYRYVDPIDVLSPALDQELPDGTIEFTVTPIQPESHELEVRWWVIEGSHPSSGDRPRQRRTGRIRPLPLLDAKPVSKSKSGRGGVHRFVFDPQHFGSGTWTVVCRVNDPTIVKRQPWVIRDLKGLLESERRWVVNRP
jgi:IgA peptidase M64